MATTAETITFKSSGYYRRINSWRTVRDALEGEAVIKAAGTTYLPKPSGMDADPYAAYKTRASFFDVVDRTLRGLLGMVFRIDPKLELPVKLAPLLESATPDGSDINLVIREAVRENTSMGRWGVLVDMAPGQTVGGAPYLATYVAEAIINWEEVMVRGQRILTRVVLVDDATTSEDDTTSRILNLELDKDGLYVMTVWEAVDPVSQTSQADASTAHSDLINAGFQKIESFEPTAQGQRLTEIPFWFINTYDTRATTSKPPMLALADMSLAHYRNSADYEHALFLTACPTPWTAGMAKDDRPTSIGSATIWHLPKGGEAGILEFSGAGISAQAQAMSDKERRMAVLGARLISEETRNVTAETTRLNSKSETSVLTEAVNNAESGLTSALRFAAVWAGGNPDDVVLEINRDYIETRMEPDELNALITGWQAGAYSKATLHDNLQRGEIVDPQLTVEDEQERIDKESADQPPDGDDDVREGIKALLARGNGDGDETGGDIGGGDGSGDDDGNGAGDGGA